MAKTEILSKLNVGSGIDTTELIKALVDADTAATKENLDNLEEKANNQISTFAVLKNSTSLEIKNAIEMIFKVKVRRVNTSILRGKGKTFKGQYGFRKDTKRAIVTLVEGNTIDSSLEIK